MIKPLAEVEKEKILEAILEMRSVYKAAKALGITPNTVYKRIRQYGLKLKVGQMLAELRRQKSIVYEIHK